jgi:cytochrome c
MFARGKSLLALGLPLGLAFAVLSGGLPMGSALAEGDAVAGKKIFRKCAACHTLEPGKKKVGPSLYGVIGRTAGTAEGFKFSKAMKAYGESGVVWSAETLDAFLTAPRKVVKGTRMGFPGLKMPRDRADVITYIEQVPPR